MSVALDKLTASVAALELAAKRAADFRPADESAAIEALAERVDAVATAIDPTTPVAALVDPAPDRGYPAAAPDTSSVVTAS